MQAIVVREGGVLSVEEVADPVAAPGEVVVELRCAAVQPSRSARPVSARTCVRVPAAAHPGLGRILGGPDDGTYAELVTLPAENVFPKPRRLSWEEAVASHSAG